MQSFNTNPGLQKYTIPIFIVVIGLQIYLLRLVILTY